MTSRKEIRRKRTESTSQRRQQPYEMIDFSCRNISFFKGRVRERQRLLTVATNYLMWKINCPVYVAGCFGLIVWKKHNVK